MMECHKERLVCLVILFIRLGMTTGITTETPNKYYNPFDCFPGSKCRCSRTPGIDGINKLCSFESLALFKFKWLQDPRIRWLGILCPSFSYISGKLSDEDFSGVQNLEELVISGCVLSHISRRAFAGLNGLQILEIVQAANDRTYPKFEPGWTQPLTKLRHLDLSWNNITGFPNQEFCGLHQLETLDLSHNRLSSFSIGLGCNENEESNSTCHPCLPNVTTLDLSNNGITVLDINFDRDIPRLKYFNASHCSISALSTQTHFPQTSEDINLSHNKLSELMMESLNNTSNLHQLSLQNNVLRNLPIDFFNVIKNLRYLNISGNFLTGTTLHLAGLKELQQLRRLDMSNNNIRTIQTAMLEGMVNLNELSCSNCTLENIESGAFLRLSKLTKLKLDKNLFHVLGRDTFYGLHMLTSLDLSWNKLTSFEVTRPLQSLIQLQLGTNNLQRLPDFSDSWMSLIALDLKGNNITNIESKRLSGLGNLRGLRISYNKIGSIPSYAFSSLAMLNVLNLENNNISFIEYSAFQGLTKLTHLKLQKNRISNLEVYLTPLTSLQYLYMSQNMVQSIKQIDLPTTLQFIDLSWNQVHYIELEAFRKLDHLLAMDLTYNGLDSVTRGSLMMSQKVWLRPQVFLRGNWLHCDCNMEWLRRINSNTSSFWRFPLVPDLDLILCSARFLGRTNLFLSSRPTSDFLCSYTDECHLTCHCCDKVDCPCHSFCYDNCTCFRDNSYAINTADCSSRNLTELATKRPKFAKYLYLDQNNLTSLEPEDFNFPMLTHLFLNKCSVSYIGPSTFHYSGRIKDIYLQDNNIKEINRSMFGNVSTLEQLFLQNNKIDKIERGSFDNCTSLKTLYLHGNNLERIDLALFDNLNSFPKLTLHGNPWVCDCQTGPAFQRWLVRHSEQILNVHNTRCTVQFPINQSGTVQYNTTQTLPNSNFTEIIIIGNQTGKHQAVVDIDFTKFCQKPSYLTVIQENKRKITIGLVSMACTFVAFGILVVVIYTNRLLIMVWVYNRYGLRFKQHEDKDNEDKDYDVYIAHARDDESFVVRELLPGLEDGENPYKVCVVCRDWPGGTVITDTIIASVEQSKRTILVVSENYFKSEWCHYEFLAAHYQVLVDRQIRLLIVLTDKKLRSRFEPDMKLYLRVGTYLVYGEKWFWKKLRYFLADNPRGDQNRDEPFTLLNVYKGRNIPYLGADPETML